MVKNNPSNTYPTKPVLRYTMLGVSYGTRYTFHSPVYLDRQAQAKSIAPDYFVYNATRIVLHQIYRLYLHATDNVKSHAKRFSRLTQKYLCIMRQFACYRPVTNAIAALDRHARCVRGYDETQHYHFHLKLNKIS